EDCGNHFECLRKFSGVRAGIRSRSVCDGGVIVTEGVYSLADELSARTRRRPAKAVVLAGGLGTRLAPYTSVLPKPLMPIGDRSILELVLGQLTACRITDVTLCVGYLSHLIEAVLENRPHDGARISYVKEQEALGTAAPLRHVPDLDT